MTKTPVPGDRVKVAADADDVYFGGEVVGRVVEPYDEPIYFRTQRYRDEARVLVEAPDLENNGEPLDQYVRPEDLTRVFEPGDKVYVSAAHYHHMADSTEAVVQSHGAPTTEGLAYLVAAEAYYGTNTLFQFVTADDLVLIEAAE